MQNVQVSAKVRGPVGDHVWRAGTVRRPNFEMAETGYYFAPLALSAVQGATLSSSPFTSSFADVLGSLLGIQVSSGQTRPKAVERWSEFSVPETESRRVSVEMERRSVAQPVVSGDHLSNDSQDASSIISDSTLPAASFSDQSLTKDGYEERLTDHGVERVWPEVSMLADVGKSEKVTAESATDYASGISIAEISPDRVTGISEFEYSEVQPARPAGGMLDAHSEFENADLKPVKPGSEVLDTPHEFKEMIVLAEEGREEPTANQSVLPETPLTGKKEVAKGKMTPDATVDMHATSPGVVEANASDSLEEPTSSVRASGPLPPGKVLKREGVLEAESQVHDVKEPVETSTSLQMQARGVRVSGVVVLETPVVQHTVGTSGTAGAGATSGTGQVGAVGTRHSSEAPLRPAVREATPSANQETMIERIARVTLLSLQRNRTHLKMMLYPPELGSVRLDLSLKNGALKASLTTETVVARDVLAQNLDALRSALDRHGISVSDLSVSVQGGEQGAQTFNFRPEVFVNLWEKRVSAESEEAEVGAPVSLSNSKVDLFA